VFSTKNRVHYIRKDIQDDLFSYMGGICKSMECYPLIIGGYKDHVHILCLLSRKIALMKLVEEVKAHSSGWIKRKYPDLENFYWQRGYGCFSVQADRTDVVIKYIQNQEYHHQNKSFKEEYLDFLHQYKIDYDPNYLWD